MRNHRPTARPTRRTLAAAFALLGLAGGAAAQDNAALVQLVAPEAAPALRVAAAAPLPVAFAPGERLDYQVRAGRFGTVGRAEMRVGRDTLRGRAVWRLDFDMKGKVLLFGVESRTRSWIDPSTMTSLRYTELRKGPGADRDEAVDVFAADHAWRAEDGTEGAAPCDAPLDELSFIYFIRTMPLRTGETTTLDRHFDVARNPVTIRVVGRGTLRTPAGEFDVVRVDMEVRDPEHVDRMSTVRLWLSDDARRIPVRMETSVSLAGTTTLELVRVGLEG